MGSSQKMPKKILGVITEGDAERLLLDWANMGRDAGLTDIAFDPKALFSRRLKAQHAVIDRIIARSPSVFAHFEHSAKKDYVGLETLLVKIKADLRRAWNEPDARHREWYLFQLRRIYHESNFRQQHKKDYLHIEAEPKTANEWMLQWNAFVSIQRDLANPPPLTAFEAAIFHCQQIATRAKYCSNPDCPAPYFIAKKPWQKYCSEVCAARGNREAKRKWWHEKRGKRSL
jgi:hypothetical protein